MTARRVILLRHGQTDYNVARRVQGNIDIALNAAGIAQASAAADSLAAYLEGHEVQVVSSPLGRAVVTAQAVADRLGVELLIDEAFRERSFGRFEGLDDAAGSAQYPEEWALWRSDGEAPHIGIEAREQVGERMAAGIERYAAELPAEAVLVVVSHGSAITQGLRLLLGIHDCEWPVLRGLDNCHYSELQGGTFAAGQGWRLFSHNCS
ncbi:MAG: histidine phosphatase family protein [Bowdeniella nasicola]|nr:histidine phosphatase family protein [Bowdeniella nasicola]